MDKRSRALRQQFFRKRIPVYRKNPVLFAREVLLFEPDEWQRKALMDLAENPKVAIKSGQGVGKTGMEAVALLWFLTCYPYPRIVATAPTKQQLHDVLWSEVSKWMSKSPLLSDILKWTKTYIYMVGNEKRWFAVARTATKPENMQGFHEDNMLFIVDEASGVADPIMEAILGTLSGDNNKLLMCGNPTRTSGTFYDAFNGDRAIYKCHTVSSADSPRTNKENIQSLIKKYGRESNVVLVRVFGEFPKQEDDVFIGLSIIEHCTMLDLPEGEPVRRISLGVDVARYGSDETIIARNVGGNITLPIKFRGQSLMTTVGKIIHMYRETIVSFPAYRGMDDLPENWTYPLIQPKLIEKYLWVKSNSIVGATVTVTVDRPLGSYHPEYKDMYYPINYGYIEGVMAPDGEEQDAYILGVNEPVCKFTGKIIAIVYRKDDIEEKWVVVPDGVTFSKEEIRRQIHFQEQYFDSEIVM